jgi:MFS transporter, putative metabolite:H+ symporter
MTAPTTQPSSATVTAGEISARLERLPLSRWHVKARLVVGAVTFFDGFDQLMIAYALPVLIPLFDLSAAMIAWTIAVGGIGMLFGALVGGWLADHVGRLKVIVWSLLVYGATSLGMTFVDTLWVFLALRFVQGFGLGAEVPVAATYIGEITRAHRRGRFVLLYELIFPAGLVMSAIVAAWVVPTFGWRWLFAIGALPVVLAFFLKRIPESPRWLASRDRLAEADANMCEIEAAVQKQTGAPLPPVEPTSATYVELRRAKVQELFQGVYRRRTLMLCAIWATAYFVNYGIAAWLPSIYGSVFGLSVGEALRYSIATSVAGLLGCLVIALVIDHIGRRIAITASMVCTSALLFLLAADGAQTATSVLLWASGSAVFVFAVNLALYVYTAELYPTRIRALGCSVGGACARAGIIAGPLVVGQIFDAGGTVVTVFAVLAAVALVGAVTTGVFATETKERPLEEISR